MKDDRSLLFLSFLTLLGVVGLYLGAYYAWTKYQAEKAALKSDPIGTLTGLLTS